MKVERVGTNHKNAFVIYCKKHRMEVDDSFLYDEDLDGFIDNDDNPSCVLLDDKSQVKGAASLILDEYQRHGKRGRFRIFHSELLDVESYQKLMESVLQHTEGLEKVYVFVPLVNKNLSIYIESQSFVVERYAFLLVRDLDQIPSFQLSDGYELKDFIEGQDEETWCKVRNASFAKLQGSETPISPAMVTKMITETEHIEGGMKILYHHQIPVGVVRGSDDEYENAPIMNIGPVAIVPEYQGKGLGRVFLRAALQFAKDKGYSKAILSVNGENERAKALYEQEGFIQVEAVTCYKYLV
ncbi:GNAT family N-acetyltransferase [Bacillaceae bacterium S4-13-56]